MPGVAEMVPAPADLEATQLDRVGEDMDCQDDEKGSPPVPGLPPASTDAAVEGVEVQHLPFVKQAASSALGIEVSDEQVEALATSLWGVIHPARKAMSARSAPYGPPDLASGRGPGQSS